MKIPRFFQRQDFSIDRETELSPVNHRHAVQVLRLKVNDCLILFNGNGGEYVARLTEVNKRNSKVLIKSYDPVNRESELKITLVLALIKPEKMDFAIQKAVELGVFAIQPVYTRRSVIKIKPDRLEKKMHHWQGVINNACEQSARTAVPEIFSPLDLDIWMEKNPDPLNIAMLPGNHPRFADLTIAKPESIALLIGPEGGFTEDEVQQMQNTNLTAISFGPRILRAETAAIAGISACQQRWGDL